MERTGQYAQRAIGVSRVLTGPGWAAAIVVAMLGAVGCNDGTEPTSSSRRGPNPAASSREVSARASALTGDLISTLNVDPAAQCPSGIGTSVAVVPGIMVNLDTTFPILLATSCFSDTGGAERSKIFLLNPANGALVKTIVTSFVPAGGWGSIVTRPDRNDLLGCASNTSDGLAHDLYRIAPDGTSTFMFSAAAGFDICDGVAWDAPDDTIWMSPDISDTIYHYSETGTLLGTIPAPSGCPNSGLAVGGSSLFASCDGVLTMYQLNKATGAVFTSFSTAGQRTEDLDCDPFTFGAMGGPGGRTAMWSKDAFTSQLFAFEIPSGTCGPLGGPPTIPGACPDGSTTDTDGDGLLDCWETGGIDANGDGTVDLTLYDDDGNGTVTAAERPSPMHKDLYVEVDFMAQHQPLATAMADIVAAFAAANVTNPDGVSGIRLHIIVDEQAVTHSTELAFRPCSPAGAAGTPDFDVVKNGFFGRAGERAGANAVNVLNAKRLAFRYGLFIHNLVGTTSSGCAELPGNDFVVSLGSFDGEVGNRFNQRGTMMHEFGHTLILRHGGGDHINYKPNYLSVMTYGRQLENFIPGRPLDYSRAALGNLLESALLESVGIGGPAGSQTVFFNPPGTSHVVSGTGAIDWNQNAITDGAAVTADVNNDALAETLISNNDWAGILYNFRTTVDYSEGVHSSTVIPEITVAEARALSPDKDGDGVNNLDDNCPTVFNPGQADANHDHIGDACQEVALCPPGTNIILGTSNDDTLVGTPGADCILGFGGQDHISGGGGADVIFGGDGDDVIDAGDGDDVVSGGTGQDQLTGGAGNDTISGDDGDDTINGGVGNDTLHGNNGNDHVNGNDGNDLLFGETGDDTLNGGAGNDTLNGGGLHDLCIGGGGTDTFVTCERRQ